LSAETSALSPTQVSSNGVAICRENTRHADFYPIYSFKFRFFCIINAARQSFIASLLPSGLSLSLNHNNINELHLPAIHIYCPSQFGQTLHNTVMPNLTLQLALGLGLGIGLVVFAAGVLFLASEKE
jgi:hypothetical protein